MNDKVISINRPNTDGGTTPARKGKRKDGNRFMINRQSAVPLHIQLKEQIRYAIMSGDYQPGSPLPSIRELTSQLGIHRNTVHRVYLELQAGGLLASRPGKGVFVNETLSDTVSVDVLNAIDALIERVFTEAGSIGVNAITFSKLLGQRAPDYDSRHPNIAFVECTAHQSQESARDLATGFGIQVVNLLLEDLRSNPESLPDSIQHLITSSFHYDELLELSRPLKRKVHPITYDIHPASRKMLRDLPGDRKLGFICHDANTEEVIGREVAACVPEKVFIGCANLEAQKMALQLIKKVDTVVLTEPASAFCIKNCTPEHELLELHFTLNPASVDKVTRTVMVQP